MITAEELHSRVRQLINETDDDSAVTLLTDDTRSIDEHIDALMPDAVLFVQKNKRAGVVNPKSVDAGEVAITDNGDGTGFLELPDDFVSLVSFELDGWQRPCTKLYPAASAEARVQCNPYMRAGCCKPVCIEGISHLGKRLLCYYSLPHDVTPVVNRFVYEAVYNPQEGLLGTDVALHKAVVYQCVALLYGMFERGDNAGYFSGVAASLCNNVELDKKE